MATFQTAKGATVTLVLARTAGRKVHLRTEDGQMLCKSRGGERPWLPVEEELLRPLCSGGGEGVGGL